jgi:O-antigen ligase
MTSPDLRSESNGGSASDRVPTPLLRWAIALPLLAASIVDVPRLWRVGEWSWLGILAVAQLAVAGGALVVAGVPRRLHGTLWPIGALLLWMALGTLWWPKTFDTPPNALAYLLFGATVSAAALAATVSRRSVARSIDNTMLAVDIVGLSIVAVSFASSGFRIHSWIVHPRALAMVALVPLCWHLARWSAGRLSALIPAAAWIAAILVSLSRMAMGAALVAVVLTVLLHVIARRGVRWQHVVLLVLLLLGALGAVASVDPFRERLLKQQDRLPIWQRVVASALQAPIIGNGLGSSQTGGALGYWWTIPPPGRAPSSLGYEYNEYWAPHPHNEYLRVWHDLGLPGIACFLTALGTWLWTLYGGWRRSGEHPIAGNRPPLELAGLLMLLVLMVAMLTDNPLVYPFVIAPAAVLIGAGLGASVALRGRRDD